MKRALFIDWLLSPGSYLWADTLPIPGGTNFSAQLFTTQCATSGSSVAEASNR